MAQFELFLLGSLASDSKASLIAEIESTVTVYDLVIPADVTIYAATGVPALSAARWRKGTYSMRSPTNSTKAA